MCFHQWKIHTFAGANVTGSCYLVSAVTAACSGPGEVQHQYVWIRDERTLLTVKLPDFYRECCRAAVHDPSLLILGGGSVEPLVSL